MRKLILIAALLLLVGCMQTKQVEILSNQKDTLDLSDTLEFYK